MILSVWSRLQAAKQNNISKKKKCLLYNIMLFEVTKLNNPCS